MTAKTLSPTAPLIGNTAEWLQVTPGERFTIRTSTRHTNGAYAVFEFVADPGNGVHMHVHDNEEEHIIILDGTALVANGNHTFDATVGTSFTVSRGIPHAWCNVSDRPHVSYLYPRTH
jgi:quercetin dioxygenase-like cupin family protein